MKWADPLKVKSTAARQAVLLRAHNRRKLAHLLAKCNFIAPGIGSLKFEIDSPDAAADFSGLGDDLLVVRMNLVALHGLKVIKRADQCEIEGTLGAYHVTAEDKLPDLFDDIRKATQARRVSSSDNDADDAAL